MPKFKDLFICYEQHESLSFVARLHQQLRLAGYQVWFDKINLPLNKNETDYINHAIESAGNFIYVMAPHALCSPACLMQLEYAHLLGKRIIPINHYVIEQTDKGELSEEIKQALTNFYQTHNIPDPELKTYQQLLDQSLHKVVDRKNWLQGKEILSDQDCEYLKEWAHSYEGEWCKHETRTFLKNLALPQFGQVVDNFDEVVTTIKQVLECYKNYIHQHTLLLNKALIWKRNQLNHNLLTEENYQKANEFLLTMFREGQHAPCIPSALVCEFVCESYRYIEPKQQQVATELKKLRITAKEQRDQALSAQSLFLADLAAKKVKENRPITAMKLVLEALPKYSTTCPDRPAIEDVQVLFEPLYNAVQKHWQGILEHDKIDINATEVNAVFSPNGKLLATLSLGYLYIWDMESLQLLNYFTLNSENSKDISRAITRIIFSPNSQQICTILVNRKACLWDIKSGKQLHFFRHKNVTHTIFSSDSSMLCTISDKKTARLWEVNSSVLLHTFSHHSSINHASFSSNNKLLCTVSGNRLSDLGENTARLWDIKSGKLLHTLVHENTLYHSTFSPDNNFLSTASNSKESHLWEVQSGKLLHTFKHDHIIESTTFSPDGTMLSTLPENKKVYLHDVQSGKLLHIFEHDEFVEDTVFSADSQILYTITCNVHNPSYQWDTKSGKQLDTFKHNTDILETMLLEDDSWYWYRIKDYLQNTLAVDEDALYIQNFVKAILSSEGDIFCTSSLTSNVISPVSQNNVYLWRNDLNESLHTIKHNRDTDYSELENYDDVEVIFSPDGSMLCTTLDTQSLNMVHVWETHSARLLYTLKYDAPVFSPDSQIICTVSDNKRDKKAYLWDSQSGKLLKIFEHNSRVGRAAFSPNGKMLCVTSANNAVKAAHIWDIQSGKLINTFEHIDYISHVVFSPDNSLLSISSMDESACLWEIKSGKLLHTFDDEDWIWRTEFSPDGHLLCIPTGNDNTTTHLWDVKSGKAIHTFEHDKKVNNITFSPDGSLVSTSSESIACLWDVKSGKKIHTFRHPSSYESVLHTEFSPDGILLKTHTSNKTYLWDIKSTKIIYSSNHHFQFSPDGKYIAADIREYNTTQIWPAFKNLDELVDYVKNLLAGHPLQHRLSRLQRKEASLEECDHTEKQYYR